VIAYLIRERKLSFDDAFHEVKSRRKIVSIYKFRFFQIYPSYSSLKDINDRFSVERREKISLTIQFDLNLTNQSP
jgi:hypothetical protein